MHEAAASCGFTSTCVAGQWDAVACLVDLVRPPTGAAPPTDEILELCMAVAKPWVASPDCPLPFVQVCARHVAIVAGTWW